jgi:hypothetical protein
MRYIDPADIRVFFYLCYDFIGLLPFYLNQPATSRLTLRHTLNKLDGVRIFFASIFTKSSSFNPTNLARLGYICEYADNFLKDGELNNDW